MNAEQKRAWLGVATMTACIVDFFTRSVGGLASYGRQVEAENA